MAILILLLFFSAVSTLVFRSKANIFNIALTNLFLSLSLLISSSNYSWTESKIFNNKSRALSVASLSLLSFVKNASSSLLISSNNMAWFSVFDLRTLRIIVPLILLNCQLTCLSSFFVAYLPGKFIKMLFFGSFLPPK